MKRELSAKAREERCNRLAPNGIPRYIRVYDNEGATADRYTVVFSRPQAFYTKGYIPVLGMSANPFHPQGVGMHDEYRIGELAEANNKSHWPPAIGRKGPLGKRIAFQELPNECKALVCQDYINYWQIR